MQLLHVRNKNHEMIEIISKYVKIGYDNKIYQMVKNGEYYYNTSQHLLHILLFDHRTEFEYSSGYMYNDNDLRGDSQAKKCIELLQKVIEWGQKQNVL